MAQLVLDEAAQKSPPARGRGLKHEAAHEHNNIRIQPPPDYDELLIDLSEYEKAVLIRTIAAIKTTLVQMRNLL